MAKRLWKTYAGRCIYKSPSGARVYQNFFYRWLTLESDALQSLINRRHPQKPELRYANQLTVGVRSQPGECCMLGLGGAGVAHILASYLGNSTLTVVENDAEIIKIAAEYFMSNELKNLSIVHQDANLFVQQSQHQYQHLLVDLFGAHTFPAQCNTHDFFRQCQRLLLPNGILAVNLADMTEQRSMFEWIREDFQQRTVVLPVKGAANIIILAFNGSSITPLLSLLENSGELKKLSWSSQWGWMGWSR